jgi:hypothetical protein
MWWWIVWCQQFLIEIAGVWGVLGEVFLPQEVLEVETLFAGTCSLCLCLREGQYEESWMEASDSERHTFLGLQSGLACDMRRLLQSLLSTFVHFF